MADAAKNGGGDGARKGKKVGAEAEKGGGSRVEVIDLNNVPDPSIELDNSPSRQAKKTPRARISPGFPVGNRNRARADPSSRTRKPPALKGAPPMAFYHVKPGTTRILYRLNPKFGKDFTHTVGPLYAADPDPLEAPIPFRRGGARAGAGAGAGLVYERAIWTTEDMDSLAGVMADFHHLPLTIRVWNAASIALTRSHDSCRNYYRDHKPDIDKRIAKALEVKEKEKDRHRHREEEEEEEQQPREEATTSVQAGKQPITERLSDNDY